jgi:alkylated DNA repair dioxygenase AlkB
MGKNGKNQYFDGKSDVNKLASGDSYYIKDFVKSRTEKDEIFKKLLKEVEFEQMFNVSPKNAVYPIPRLVAAQTTYEDPTGVFIYRMPGCNQSNIPTKHWTPTVKYIRDKASELLGQEFNHCLIGLFRDEHDSLAYHKDKLLDLEDDSVIISVSFGEARPIVFKSERDSSEQKILLRPGSLLVFGQKTNHQYKHEIPKIPRPDTIGPRISLSFRTIDTKMCGDKVIGKGEEHQCDNYPFIKSFSDVSEYTDEMKEQVEFYKERTQKQIQALLKNTF